MLEDTKKQIHNAFIRAGQGNNIDIVSFETNFSTELQKISFDNEDAPIIKAFLKRISHDSLVRGFTFQYQNIITDIINMTMYLISWLNETYQYQIDANICARRKSLTSDLAKQLLYSETNNLYQVLDLFGIRFVILNDEDAIRLSCILAKKFFSVLCSIDSSDREDFIEYLERFDVNVKNRILKVLNIPFILRPIKRTDNENDFNPSEYPDIELPTKEDRAILSIFEEYMKFYYAPKKNGYQSNHFILEIDATSAFCPGFKLEIQFRTIKMHNHNENSHSASHSKHKEKFENYHFIFQLSEKEEKFFHIRGFISSKGPENDLDGIYYPKFFCDRRVPIVQQTPTIQPK